MKANFDDQKNTRPALDRLQKDYTIHIDGSLIDTLVKLPLNQFQTDDSEYVFQLIEAELRATDAIHVKSLLETLKEAHHKKWVRIHNYAQAIEEGKLPSAASHQLIALIQLTDEG